MQLENRTQTTVYSFLNSETLKKNQIKLLNLPIFNYDDVILLEILSKSAFGIIRKAYNKRKEKFIVLKFFAKESQEQIILEDNILQKVEEIVRIESNDNFCEYYGLFKDESNEKKLLLMEIGYGITTLDDILSAGKRYRCSELIEIIKELVKSFAILQENGIAHRDIKTNNIIIIKEKDRFLYKVFNFGNACQLPKEIELISCISIIRFTKKYSAPELSNLNEKIVNDPLHEHNYNPYAADVYSLGIIVLEMINSAWGKLELSEGLLRKKETFLGYEPIFTVLQKVLEENPAKRMDFKQLHAFIQEKMVEEEEENEENKENEENEENDEGIEFYYQKSLNDKERSIGKTKEGARGLFEEHKKLYEANKDTKMEEAFMHLERAWHMIEQLNKIGMDLNNINEEKKSDETLTERNDNFYEAEEIYCLNQFGDLYRKIGKFKKSEEFFKESLKKCETFSEKKQENKLYFSETYVYLGLLYEYMKDLVQAEKFYVKSLKIKQKLFGENHADTRESCNKLAEFYYDIRNFVKAEEFFLKSLKISQDLFGENHEETAVLCNNLGSLYDDMANYNNAEEFYLKSFRIRMNLFGENNVNTANSLNNLGLLYNNMGNFSESEEFYLKSLKIRKHLFGENHSFIAGSYNNLGGLYENMGEFDRAKEFYLKSIKITKDLFGENDSDTALSYFNLSFLFEKIGLRSKGKDYAKKAFKIVADLYGDEHWKTKKYLNHLNFLKKEEQVNL